MKKQFLICTALFILGSCTPNVKIDPVMAAYQANDVTGLIEGCGNQIIAGFTYCRKVEGDAANDSIYMIAPPLECEGDVPCVSFKVIYPDGRPPYGGAIPKGQSRFQIPWTTLLGRQTFEVNDRGVWGFIYTARWKDSDGNERKTIAEGEIVLRVYKKGYIPLDNSEFDPNFAFEWVENGQRIKVTTGGRTWVQRKR